MTIFNLVGVKTCPGFLTQGCTFSHLHYTEIRYGSFSGIGFFRRGLCIWVRIKSYYLSNRFLTFDSQMTLVYITDCTYSLIYLKINQKCFFFSFFTLTSHPNARYFFLLLYRRSVTKWARSSIFPNPSLFITDLRKFSIVLKRIDGNLKTYTNGLLQEDIKTEFED